jgi:hypothetical protein
MLQPNMLRPSARAFACAFFVLLAASLVSTSALAEPGPAKSDLTKSDLAKSDLTEQAEQTRVYALIVANNSSVDPGVKPLQFADDDGARYFELFESLTDEARLLTTLDADSQKLFPKVVPHTKSPTRAQLKETVGELSQTVRDNRKAGIQSEVYLVFTGHGNVDDDGQGYLSLRDGKLHRKELFRDIIQGIKADYTHLIVDACHSYFMVESRGGDDQWRDDSSDETLDEELNAYLSRRGEAKIKRSSTVGVIVSTSGTAEVHEWSRFRAGVFSHQLRSALLGAADVDQDGKINYAEVEAYLVAANAGVANPRARINVYAQPPAQDRSRPLVALESFKNATMLEIPAKAGGRFHLEDGRGLRYADFNVEDTLATRVVLLNEPVGQKGYYLSTGDKQALVPLDDASVSSTELAFVAQGDQSRGAVDEAFRTGLFSVSYGRGFYAGFVAGRDKYAQTAASRQYTREPEASWALDLGAGYGLSEALQDTDGVQHHVRINAAFRHESGWAIGPFASYGYSTTSVLGQDAAHRTALGAQASRTIEAGSLEIEPRVRAGYQFVYLPDARQAKADPLGARAEASLAFGWQLGDAWQLEIEPGVSLDVVTETTSDQVDESLYLQPYLGVGVIF